ncbi:zinc finger MYM-type protein 1-like protein [Tanacetum coccineum]|uniref:Zinc finger MYM-type protein 1-like protein n=1 Tax=Tanacetum coccineum TaxID=301880 RepID=A0ABQ4WBA5_9ASTR
MVEDVTQENKRSKASTSENFQPQNEPQNQTEKHISEFPKPNTDEVDLNSLERDPGKRKRMFEYPANKKEKVRLAYLNKGPFQIHLKTYLAKGSPMRPRRFQYSWFDIFPNWLEYSPTRNAAYCFVCYLFSDSPNVRNGSDAFIVKGFDNWKKVNDGKNYAFLKHIGCLQHRNAVTFCENLLNQEGHIGNIIEKQSAETIIKNRILLKASIDIVRWLTFQISSFRGRDETLNSKNRGNFIELLKLLASYNVEGTKTFDISKICHLVEKYYPVDFTEQEIYRLRSELEIFGIDMQNNKKLRKASTIAELCVSLVKTEKRETYYLFDRLIRLILTLPVSTATTERHFRNESNARIESPQ